MHRLAAPRCRAQFVRARRFSRGGLPCLRPLHTIPPPARHATVRRVLNEDQEKRRAMENELRDPKNFLEYFLPRPLRLPFFGFSAASCLIALVLSATHLIQESQAGGGLQASELTDVAINVAGLLMFSALYVWDKQAAQTRVVERKRVRDAQIAFGDREVYVNEQGEKMSRLKEVNDEWILRRLERWGQRNGMPFIGPKKGAVLAQLVADKAPQSAVEVGTQAGYSAILIAQALPPGSRLVSYEKDLSWFLVAKRFLWQANQGGSSSRPGDKVEVVWGDAVEGLRRWADRHPGRKIDFLFLDGVPKQSLEYLQAAEPHLAHGALVVADNAGVFAAGGMKPYLEYVRGDSRYASSFIESTLEWRDDVKDGLEVSFFFPQGANYYGGGGGVGGGSAREYQMMIANQSLGSVDSI